MRRKPLRLVFPLIVATSCGLVTDPAHAPIQGAVIAGYYQTVIDGEPTSEVAKKSLQSSMVIQYAGKLCLFQGGNYSYQADYWYYNSVAMKSNADKDGLKFGTYTGDPASSLALEGRLTGFAPIVGDTLTLGTNKFQRSANLTATCEQMR